jgi:hypothetical protein
MKNRIPRKWKKTLKSAGAGGRQNDVLQKHVKDIAFKNIASELRANNKDPELLDQVKGVISENSVL